MTSSSLNVHTLLDSLASDLALLIKKRQLNNPYIVGIQTGGVWVAEHLRAALEISEEVGSLDICFYRDDFDQTGMHRKSAPSSLPVPTDDRDIILVDDVILSGRTIRAAINELFDYGRPASVTLVTMIDLQRRQLPFQPDVVGTRLLLSPGERVKLVQNDELTLEIKGLN